MKECPECHSKQKVWQLLSLTNFNRRFLCANCNIVLETDIKYLQSTGGIGAGLLMLTFYGLENLLYGQNNGLFIGILLMTVLIIFLGVFYLKNIPIHKSENQSKEEFINNNVEYKLPPRPKNSSLKEQFKSRYYSKSIQELESIIENPRIVEKAKEAAKELLEIKQAESRKEKSI